MVDIANVKHSAAVLSSRVADDPSAAPRQFELDLILAYLMLRCYFILVVLLCFLRRLIP